LKYGCATSRNLFMVTCLKFYIAGNVLLYGAFEVRKCIIYGVIYCTIFERWQIIFA
jgi:hypothetical protein